tara:strand:+ start:963 stop:1625 length:663 start_codon:yes stop_codon:yes gene_type:complete
VISYPEQLQSLLKKLTKEAVQTALSENPEEEERQKSLARDLRGKTYDAERPMLVDEEESEEAQGEEEAKKEPEQDEKFVKLDVPPEIKFQDIRKMIDQLRSGKSLKDPETKMELVDYYDDLDEPDRIALYKFLAAISVILTKDVEGSDVQEPDQGKGKVDVKTKSKVKAPDPNKKSIKQKIKKSVKKKSVDKSAPEREFSPPIKVGESQDKRDVITEIIK